MKFRQLYRKSLPASRPEMPFHLGGNDIHQQIGPVSAETLHEQVGIVIRRQSGGMRQQVPQDDIDLLPCFGILPRLETGNVALHGIGQAHIAPLDQLHERERGPNALAQRGQVEHRISRHRHDIRDDGLVPVGLQVHDIIPPHNGQHSARDIPGADGIANDRVHPGKPLRVHPVVLRLRHLDL